MTLKKYTDSDLALVESLLTEEEIKFLTTTGLPTQVLSLAILDEPEVVNKTNVVLYRESPDERIGFRDNYLFIEVQSRKILQSDETLSHVPDFNNNLVNSSLTRLVQMNETLEVWLSEMGWPDVDVIDYDEYEKFKDRFLLMEDEFAQYWFNYITTLEMYTE